MNPDDTVRVDRSREEPGLAGTASEQTRHNQSDTAGHEADSAQPAAEPMGWSERLRQIMQRPAQGQARTNIKRQQLREDRTKAFLMLAGSTVVLGLMFFALFSSPSSSHKDNSARPNRPNLGRGPGGEGADTSRSVTPLLNADTRNPNEDPGKLNPQDIQNTARARMSAETSVPPLSPAPQPAVLPPPRDYALNRIQFPAEPEPVTVPAAAPAGPKVDKLTSASLVFVSAGAGTGTREKLAAGGNMQPALLEPQFSLLPAGTRLVARLQTPVSTAVKTPIVAAIEYNYERDGEIVIPAGSKAFGELDQASDQGYIGIRFNSIQLPDGTSESIDGRAMGLNYQPIQGKVTGRNTGKKFLVRSLTGVGEILAATVGTGGGLGVNDTISNNVLLRQRLADNVAVAGEQQMNELAYRQNIVVTVSGNTRFYIVLGKPGDRGARSAPGGSVPASNPNSPSYSAGSTPSVQELRELLELRNELTQMYQQQQAKPQIAQTGVEQQ
jgi:hypothetical protein